MKIKKITALCITVVMLLLCSGCSLNFFSVESLMSPPAQSGRNGEVEAAFKKLMSEKTVQLRSPASGEYQTAFVLFDVNHDGSEEAIVFYTDSSIDASVRMAFLECINDTWMISADIKGAGSSVYDVTFSDLDNIFSKSPPFLSTYLQKFFILSTELMFSYKLVNSLFVITCALL